MSNDTFRQIDSLTIKGKGRFNLGPNPQPKHAIANCNHTVGLMLLPGECKRGVKWICRNNFAFLLNYFGPYHARLSLLILATATAYL